MEPAGAKVTSLSRGKMGLRQRVWPRLRRLALVEPGASGRIEPLPALDPQLPAPHEAAVIVGPEGGWTAAEVEAAERSCRLVTLGGRTLRADAMALVGVTALFTAWGEYAGRAG